MTTADTVPKPPVGIDNEAWLGFWARRGVPILQSTKAALAGFAGQAETVKTSDIVDVVLRDPLLTAHALRLINQRERGSLAADVVSIESVILLMGVDAFVEQFARLQSVESLLLPKHAPRYFALLRDVATARLAARLAREFGVLRYDARLDEIFVTALLANLPRMLRYIEAGLTDKAPPVDMAGISLSLFSRWHLPEVFATLLDDESGSASQRALLHQAALRLADHLQLGWWQDGVAADIHIAAHTLGIEESEAWQLVCDSLLHFARKDWPYAQIFPPARWLPMLPGEWPKPQQPKTPDAQPAATVKVTLADILREMNRASDRGASFNQLMGLAIRALSEGVGMKRIVFSLLLAGQNALKTRYVVSANQDDALRNFQVDLAVPHMFTRLMLKPQSIWLNNGNKAQFEALLPRGLRQAAGSGEFFAMSLFVNDKPIGLFFADDQGGGLSEAQYNNFKQVCLVTGQCLTLQARHLDLGGKH
ncbi:MAG: HDOD domain-containing protein [Burkholderiales bacterium]|nr:HDOD domain-containing protein [Burkholderiales bacterium]